MTRMRMGYPLVSTDGQDLEIQELFAVGRSTVYRALDRTASHTAAATPGAAGAA